MKLKKKGFRDVTIPEDLGLRMGTKDQALWETTAKECKVMIEQYENALIVQKEVLALAERKVLEEKEKLKVPPKYT